MGSGVGPSARLARIVRDLRVVGRSEAAAVQQIAEVAVDAVDGAEFASVTVVSARGVLQTPVAVGDQARQCDRLQHDVGQGPCLDAAAGQDTMLWIDDMATEQRWPEFTRAAGGLGIASMVCFSLFAAPDGTVGALNLHSTAAHAFSVEARSLGQFFAVHAALEMSTVRDVEHLRTAVTSRDTIGQAKGMLMQRYCINDTQAFQLLARLSQERNIKLAVLARHVIDAGPDTT